MGRAQGRMKLHSWIHSLCLDHLYPPLHPDSGLGRGEQEAPGLLGAAGSEQPLGNLRVPARDNSTVTLCSGHPQVTVLCVCPTLPSHHCLVEGRGAGDGFEFISKIP